MNARDLFQDTMTKRRAHKPGGPDWQYLTRAARKYVWLMRGVPAQEWPL